MKKYIKSLPFFLIFLCFLAIVIRILLIRWARIAHVYNLADSYSPKHLSFSLDLPNNQPPGTLYILSTTYESYIQTGKIIVRLSHNPAGSNYWVNTRLQSIFMKMPFLIADLSMGFLAYFLLKKTYGKGKAILAASLIWLSPVVIYNSALWGQTDSLNNLLFVVSLFFAFKKRIFLSILCFTFSLFIKFSLLPILPFYFIFLYYRTGKQWKTIFFSILVGIISYILATFPISQNPISWLMRELPIILKGEIQIITSAAFNFWYAITCSPFSCSHAVDVSARFLAIRLDTWSYVLFGLASFPILYFQIKKGAKMTSRDNAFLTFALIALLAFVFLPKMHDRYMYPVFPLFALAIGAVRQTKQYAVIFLLLTILALINVYYSWYPTYYPSVYIYYAFKNTMVTWGLSVATVVVTGWFYIRSLLDFKNS